MHWWYSSMQRCMKIYSWEPCEQNTSRELKHNLIEPDPDGKTASSFGISVIYLSHFPGSFTTDAALHMFSNCTNSSPVNWSLLDPYSYAGQSHYQFHQNSSKNPIADSASRCCHYINFKFSYSLHSNSQ